MKSWLRCLNWKRQCAPRSPLAAG